MSNLEQGNAVAAYDFNQDWNVGPNVAIGKLPMPVMACPSSAAERFVVSGAFAERVKFGAYCLFALLWTTIVYDPIAHWVWSFDWVKPAERVTVMWQILAFFIITIGEILISVTGLELAFVAAPPTMKSFVTACWLFIIGLANLVINAPFTQLYPTMSPGIYFAMLAGALGVVTVLFVPVSMKFNRGMAAAAEVARLKETESETI